MKYCTSHIIWSPVLIFLETIFFKDPNRNLLTKFFCTISLKLVDVGGNVSLHCPVTKTERKFFYWYKQPLGHMLQTVATGSLTEKKLDEQFNNSRFNLTAGDSQCSLTIKNISKEDEATYFCQSGTAYFQSFAAGMYLAVNGDRTLTHVRQTPETTSVQDGDTVNLHCSLLSKTSVNSSQCPAKNNVYWFRVGFGASHSSFIYTNQNSCDAQQRSCDYRLSKTIQNSSDAGMYYCAVVTCGKILFGEGTKVETSKSNKFYLFLKSTVFIVRLHNMYVMYKLLIVNKQLKGTRGDEANYVALNFSTKKTKGVKRRIESPPECVYSAVRGGHPTLHEMS
uniref:Ig-like domain-containing protein n=1 Tax=Xiphophorus couchianus TaxID=32473 RepID=A0A3B5KNB5_9TELE